MAVWAAEEVAVLGQDLHQHRAQTDGGEGGQLLQRQKPDRGSRA